MTIIDLQAVDFLPSRVREDTTLQFCPVQLLQSNFPFDFLFLLELRPKALLLNLELCHLGDSQILSISL